jgi:AAA ATPase domain/Adenylate and Guanylate cyclase catalytic domain
VVGKVQEGADASVTVLGDTVNFAARLQALAEPDSVLMSEATHRLVQGMVEAGFAGEQTIKGKSEPQKVYRLDNIRQGVTRFEAAVSRGLSAFVGRERELEVLEHELTEARSELRVIDLCADPGLGKSRLLHEFRQRIGRERAFVLSGSCSPDGQQTPFLPFIEVVRGSFRVGIGEAEKDIAQKLEIGLILLGLHSARNLGLLLHLLGLKAPEGVLAGLDGVLLGLRTRELIQQLLEARCKLSPVIMVIEDLHWIDTVSEELLDKIVNSESNLPLLLVHTHRPEYIAPWTKNSRVTTVKLEPLPVTETSQIVQARLGATDLPLTLTQIVTAKAEGNPLFAEEIANYLVERGIVKKKASGIEYDPAAIETALPGSIQILLAARAAQLSPADRSLLQAASVIGRRFSRDLLVAVTSAEDIDTRLSAIQALDLIHATAASGEFSFKHALVRDALYNSLLQQPRSAFHLAIASEIEQRSHNRLAEVAETLAYHYGHTARTDKRFTYLVLAGEKSLGVYSLTDAQQYFQDALQLVESAPECTDDAGHIRLVANISYVLVMTFRLGDVARLVERHRSRIDALPGTRSVIVLSNYCLAMLMMCRMKEGLFAAKQALELASRLGDDTANAYARAAVIMSSCIVGQGDLDNIQRQVELGLQESERTDDGYLRSWIYLAAAWGYLKLGLIDRARALALELQARGTPGEILVLLLLVYGFLGGPI